MGWSRTIIVGAVVVTGEIRAIRMAVVVVLVALVRVLRCREFLLLLAGIGILAVALLLVASAAAAFTTSSTPSSTSSATSSAAASASSSAKIIRRLVRWLLLLLELRGRVVLLRGCLVLGGEVDTVVEAQ